MFTLLLFCNNLFAQNEEESVVKTHELKVNTFNLIVFKTVDFSYEYLINSESSVGVTLLFNLQDDNNDNPFYYERFAFTPYYRHYFSRKYALGFFLEAFGMYNYQEDYYDYYYDFRNRAYIDMSDLKSNNIAFGISVGSKFISRKGFLFEFYGGAGRNIYSSNEDNATEIVPRLGVSLGYRF